MALPGSAVTDANTLSLSPSPVNAEESTPPVADPVGASAEEDGAKRAVEASTTYEKTIDLPTRHSVSTYALFRMGTTGRATHRIGPSIYVRHQGMPQAFLYHGPL